MKFYQVTLFGTIDGDPCYWCGYGETEEEASKNLLQVVRDEHTFDDEDGEDYKPKEEYDVYEIIEASYGDGFRLDCCTSTVELPGTWGAKS